MARSWEMGWEGAFCLPIFSRMQQTLIGHLLCAGHLG